MDTDRVSSPTRVRWSVVYASGKTRKTYIVDADDFDSAKSKARIAMKADLSTDDLFKRVARADRVMRLGDF